MTEVLALASISLKLVGIVFLFAAALGVARFSDPFQRMHAATKAGTVGAGFVVLGTMISLGDTSTVMIGLATIVFLLVTIPVAGHLLGRAAYVSGASTEGMRGNDELEGILDRSDAPLEHRLSKEMSISDGERLNRPTTRR